jgi:hypothetical protein
MSLFDWVFWLLILLIAVLAYCIESGLSARHRAMILSSILSATVAAIFMMFLIEDHSSFGTGDPMAKEEKNKKVGGGGLRMGSGGGVTEIDEAAPADGDGAGKTIEVNPYGDADCARQPVRGGGWEVGENQLRSAYRRSVPRDQAFNTVGLRIARELK